MKASMLHDLERGNELELDWLAGHVVELGRKLGVPTPMNTAVYAALKLLSRRYPEAIVQSATADQRLPRLPLNLTGTYFRDTPHLWQATFRVSMRCRPFVALNS